MHRIELNHELEPMFIITNKIHLTWENPGPIDIDLALFTEQEKNWLHAKFTDYRTGPMRLW